VNALNIGSSCQQGPSSMHICPLGADALLSIIEDVQILLSAGTQRDHSVIEIQSLRGESTGVLMPKLEGTWPRGLRREIGATCPSDFNDLNKRI